MDAPGQHRQRPRQSTRNRSESGQMPLVQPQEQWNYGRSPGVDGRECHDDQAQAHIGEPRQFEKNNKASTRIDRRSASIHTNKSAKTTRTNYSKNSKRSSMSIKKRKTSPFGEQRRNSDERRTSRSSASAMLRRLPAGDKDAKNQDLWIQQDRE